MQAQLPQATRYFQDYAAGDPSLAKKATCKDDLYPYWLCCPLHIQALRQCKRKMEHGNE